MKARVTGAMLLLVATGAEAGDVLAPVQEIMSATRQFWSEQPGSNTDIFTEDRLARLYSKDFAEKYRAAAKYPAYDGGRSPFSYDPITNVQDGCSIEDLTIAKESDTEGVSDVAVRFNNLKCLGAAPEYAAVNELHFQVRDEEGRTVIDDVLHKSSDGSMRSMKAELVALEKSGREGQRAPDTDAE